MSEKMREEFEKIFGKIDHNTDESDRRAYEGDWFTWKNAWQAAHKHYAAEDERMNIIARNGNGGEHYEQ